MFFTTDLIFEILTKEAYFVNTPLLAETDFIKEKLTIMPGHVTFKINTFAASSHNWIIMQLFYNPDITSGNRYLSEEESRHCIRVLRLSVRDIVHITDGKGSLYETRIIDANSRKCEIEIINVEHDVGKRDYQIHIAIAPTKNIGRFEWFLEKATEIGIDIITPIICAHSERKSVNTGRLNKVIASAMKQSLKMYHPLLNEPIAFDTFIKQTHAFDKFIGYCREEYRKSLKDIYQQGRNALLLIGPEGDFGENEVEQALNSGFQAVSLGPSRLRTETAGLAGCFTLNLLNQ